MTMSTIETASATESYRLRCEDRVKVFQSNQRSVIVVADGAGGIGSGDVAADLVIREIEIAIPRVHSAKQWGDTLNEIDHRIADGESTAVVVDVRPYGIAGASVGDSCAWVIDDGCVDDLTIGQNRKPLLGSGNATSVKSGSSMSALDQRFGGWWFLGSSA